MAPVKTRLKVLLAASEMVPYCKTGGLADVVGALAAYLPPHVDLAVFLPRYKALRQNDTFAALDDDFVVPLAGQKERVRLFKNASVFLVDHPLFDREGLYGIGGRDHPDNARRFTLFSRAVLEGAKSIGFKPDIIHGHDWQTGLIPAYLKTLYAQDAFFHRTGSLITIHNIAYQGVFPQETLRDTGLPPEDFHMHKLEFYGQMNFLKAGLVYADYISTVSQNYAREIKNSKDKGAGLEGVLLARRDVLTGILNGIDTNIWNPQTDPYLSANYDPVKNIGGGLTIKTQNKTKLQKTLGLKPDPKVFFLGMVSRLDPQKGIDWAIEVLPRFLGEGAVQAVILGTGDPAYEKAAKELSRRHGKSFKAVFEFNDPLAHQIYAASDGFLMPSRFEPCGLGQMIAMRYGALPIVAQTGGLADTVTPDKGFLMDDSTAAGLSRAIVQALDCYQKDPSRWKIMVKQAAQTDFSWAASIKRYLELYRLAQTKVAAS